VLKLMMEKNLSILESSLLIGILISLRNDLHIWYLDQKSQQMKSDRDQYMLKAIDGGEQEDELFWSFNNIL
jgi:hypothetical protein